MRIDNFIRFAETVTVKEDKRVVSVTARPVLSDCTGAIYFTDLQLQEGKLVTGYMPHTNTMMGGEGAPRWHNGVIRNGATVIIPNMGETSAPLDCYIYPHQAMERESVTVGQGTGSHKATFAEVAVPGDELALLAMRRQCLRNGRPIAKHGFYQYTAAWDSKHAISLPERASARVYFEYREARAGETRP